MDHDELITVVSHPGRQTQRRVTREAYQQVTQMYSKKDCVSKNWDNWENGTGIRGKGPEDHRHPEV